VRRYLFISVISDLSPRGHCPPHGDNSILDNPIDSQSSWLWGMCAPYLMGSHIGKDQRGLRYRTVYISLSRSVSPAATPHLSLL
jgi:hypothetical protein